MIKYLGLVVRDINSRDRKRSGTLGTRFLMKVYESEEGLSQMSHQHQRLPHGHLLYPIILKRGSHSLIYILNFALLPRFLPYKLISLMQKVIRFTHTDCKVAS